MRCVDESEGGAREELLRHEGVYVRGARCDGAVRGRGGQSNVAAVPECGCALSNGPDVGREEVDGTDFGIGLVVRGQL